MFTRCKLWLVQRAPLGILQGAAAWLLGPAGLEAPWDLGKVGKNPKDQDAQGCLPTQQRLSTVAFPRGLAGGQEGYWKVQECCLVARETCSTSTLTQAAGISYLKPDPYQHCSPNPPILPLPGRPPNCLMLGRAEGLAQGCEHSVAG